MCHKTATSKINSNNFTAEKVQQGKMARPEVRDTKRATKAALILGYRRTIIFVQPRKKDCSHSAQVSTYIVLKQLF